MKTSKLKERLIEHRADGRAQPGAGDAEGRLRRCPSRSRISSSTASRPSRSPHFSRRHGFTSLLQAARCRHRQPGAHHRSQPGQAGQCRAPPPRPRATASLCPKCRAVDRTAYECVQTHGAARNTGSRAPSPRGWWPSIPRPARSTAMQADLVGISLGAGSQRCLLHPARPSAGQSTCSPSGPSRSPLETALAALKPLLESDAVLKVGQNVKYDINVLARNGIDMAPVDDTMVISFALDAGRSARRDRRRATAWTSWPSAISATNASPSRKSAAPARRRSRSAKCRSTRRRNMPPRMPTSPGGCTSISSRAWRLKAGRASTSGSTGR